MDEIVTRNQRKALEKANRKRPSQLTEAPKYMWPSDGGDPSRTRVWVSRNYLVQEFREDSGYRLSVNRTEMLPDGRWDDGLSWDELQKIKRDVGYGDRYAVEVYPPDLDLANVANMRHLWIPDTPPAIGWSRQNHQGKSEVSVSHDLDFGFIGEALHEYADALENGDLDGAGRYIPGDLREAAEAVLRQSSKPCLWKFYAHSGGAHRGCDGLVWQCRDDIDAVVGTTCSNCRGTVRVCRIP